MHGLRRSVHGINARPTERPMNPDGTTRAFGADDDKATINIETAAARGGRADGRHKSSRTVMYDKQQSGRKPSS